MYIYSKKSLYLTSYLIKKIVYRILLEEFVFDSTKELDTFIHCLDGATYTAVTDSSSLRLFPRLLT